MIDKLSFHWPLMCHSRAEAAPTTWQPLQLVKNRTYRTYKLCDLPPSTSRSLILHGWVCVRNSVSSLLSVKPPVSSSLQSEVSIRPSPSRGSRRRKPVRRLHGIGLLHHCVLVSYYRPRTFLVVHFLQGGNCAVTSL